MYLFVARVMSKVIMCPPVTENTCNILTPQNGRLNYLTMVFD